MARDHAADQISRIVHAEFNGGTFKISKLIHRAVLTLRECWEAFDSLGEITVQFLLLLF